MLENRSNDLTNTLKSLDIVLGFVVLTIEVTETHAHLFETKKSVPPPEEESNQSIVSIKSSSCIQ